LNSVHSLPLLFFFYVFSILFIFGLCPPRHRHPPTAFQTASAFNADISKWNTAAVTNMESSTSTPPSCFRCPFFHLNSVHSLPLLFFFTFSRFYFWILSTTAPTSSYSVRWCFCIQRGSFQVEYCGGDEHVCKYVHSTLLFLLLLLSLEFCPLPLLLFLRFLNFIFGFCPPRHRHPPTAFYYASAFNADLSKWNTAAVTNMRESTSTPPSCFCCCFFHLNFCPLTPVAFFFYVFTILFLDSVHHGTDILLQRSILLLPSTRIFPSGTLRR
jgi:surface protein